MYLPVLVGRGEREAFVHFAWFAVNLIQLPAGDYQTNGMSRQGVRRQYSL